MLKVAGHGTLVIAMNGLEKRLRKGVIRIDAHSGLVQATLDAGNSEPTESGTIVTVALRNCIIYWD